MASARSSGRQVHLVVAGTVAVAGAATWWWLSHVGVGTAHVAGMGHRHDSLVLSFVFLAIMWQSMMVGMMAPTLIPWLVTFDRLVDHPTRLSRLGYLVSFAAGYFVIWLGYSVVASAAQMLLARGHLIDESGALAGVAAGFVMAAGGIVQLSPVKRRCLVHCRNPVSFLLLKWRDGSRGAFTIGLRHGAFCVGCCWALMATGFAVGVMNVLWMAGLTIVVCVEQLAHRGERFGQCVGLALTVCGFILMIR